MNFAKNFQQPKFEEIEAGMMVYNWREHRAQTVFHNTGEVLFCTGEEITNLKDWRLLGHKCGTHTKANNFFFFKRDGWIWEFDAFTGKLGALVAESWAHKFNAVGVMA